MALNWFRIANIDEMNPSLAGRRSPGEATVRAGSLAAPAMNAGALATPAETGKRTAGPVPLPGDWLNALRADPRLAIQEDSIRCLICGRTFRQLTNTHLRGHGSEAAEYKRQFGYNRGRPLMCRALQRLYVERAVQAGLAARIRERPILVKPELRRLGGSRAIALEELLTRRDARRKHEGNGAHRPSPLVGDGAQLVRPAPAGWKPRVVASLART
jgi:hypothetical protein